MTKNHFDASNIASALLVAQIIDANCRRTKSRRRTVPAGKDGFSLLHHDKNKAVSSERAVNVNRTMFEMSASRGSNPTVARHIIIPRTIRITRMALAFSALFFSQLTTYLFTTIFWTVTLLSAMA